MKAIEKKICKIIERNTNDMFADLAAIVKIPSVVGSEGPAQEWIRNKMQAIGLEVETFEANREKLLAHPSYVQTDWPYEGRPNVIGKLPGSSHANSLILCGHIDVVSVEPVKQWTRDPWGAEVSDGRMYGRGTVDMKAGLIANIYAAKALIEADAIPKGTLSVFSVIEEEAGGGGGTLACLLEGFRADAMLNTEPFLKVTVAHPGILYFRVKVKGKSIHAGRAHLGVNAVGKMLPIYEAMVQLDEERARRLRFKWAEMDSGRSCNLNIGTFHAGDWPSSVAGWAVMECRLSFVLGETEETVKKEVESRIAAVASKDTWLIENPPEIEWFGWHTNPWLQDPDVPFIRAVETSGSDVLGQAPPIVGKPAGLDTRFCSEFNMSACAFGPNGGQIHGIDEYVELDTVVQTAKVAALVAHNWCNGSKK